MATVVALASLKLAAKIKILLGSKRDQKLENDCSRMIFLPRDTDSALHNRIKTSMELFSSSR